VGVRVGVGQDGADEGNEVKLDGARWLVSPALKASCATAGRDGPLADLPEGLDLRFPKGSSAEVFGGI